MPVRSCRGAKSKCLSVVRNYQQHFGVDPDIPSDNPGSRAYNKLQVIVVWLHAVLLTGGFVLLLH